MHSGLQLWARNELHTNDEMTTKCLLLLQLRYLIIAFAIFVVVHMPAISRM